MTDKDKAKQRALERFPVHEGASEEWIEVHLKNICGDYIEGYHQAEKDNELTWEDIPKILHICEQLKTRWWFRDNEQTKLIGTQVFWEEVLKQFKEKRWKENGTK